MIAGRLPGLSAAVVRDDEVVWSHAWGLAHIGAKRRVTRDTLFMLASVSKTVVATAVLQAIEDDLFELDTHVNDILSFSVRNPVHPHVPMTVRQLLTHTSSIRDNWNLLIDAYVSGDAEMKLETFLRRYLAPGGAELAPNNYYAFGPGRSYRYCNVAVALAAYLVEAASGIGFDTWCDRRIFAPLGMDRAGGTSPASPAAPSRCRTGGGAPRRSTFRTGSTAIRTIPMARCGPQRLSWPGTSR